MPAFVLLETRSTNAGIDDMVTMDHCIHVIREFELLIFQLGFAVCTASAVARFVWRELQEWRPSRKQ